MHKLLLLLQNFGNTLQKQKCIENSVLEKDKLSLDFDMDVSKEVGIVVFVKFIILMIQIGAMFGKNQ